MEDYSEIFVWGSDHFGQLGLGSKQHKAYTTPRYCSFNIIIKSISCGDQHSGFISDQGHVYTMGSNLEGRLGISDQSVRFSSSPLLVDSLKSYSSIQVSCGGGHTLVVSSEGSLFAWGYGETGALGSGSLQTQWSPVPVKFPCLYKPFEVSCGSKHSAVLARGSSGISVFLAGNGDSGQLGSGKREKETSFIQVRLSEEPVQVSCGVFHTGFLSGSGRVYMTGGNAFGQLGFGNKKGTCIARKVDALEGVFIKKLVCSSHSAALSERGDLFVWGSGIFGEYVLPNKVLSQVRDIAVGGNFSIAVDLNENIYSWGNNLNGELGLGDFEARNSPALVSSLHGKRLRNLACGNNFVIATGEDVRYQSRYKPAVFSNYQLPKETNFSITLHESPKIPVEGNRNRVLARKNGFEDSSLLENRWEKSENANELYLRELEKSKDENYKLLLEVEREHGINKQLSVENEELRRTNEALRVSENRLQHDHLLNQSLVLEGQRVKVLLEESKHLTFSLEIENKAIKEELSSLENLFKQKEKEFLETTRLKLASQESQFLDQQFKLKSEYESRVDSYELEIKQLESSLSLTNSHKNHLEDALSVSSTQISELESQLHSCQTKLKQTENSLDFAVSHKNKLEENLLKSNLQVSDLSSKLQKSELELNKAQSDLLQNSALRQRLENELEISRLQCKDLESKLSVFETEINRLDSELVYSNSQNNRLEGVFAQTSSQNSELSVELSYLKSQNASLEACKAELIQTVEALSKEINSLKQETAERENKRDYMVKIIEEKAQELEVDRGHLLSEKEMQSRTISDLTFEVARLNQVSQNIPLLEEQLALEISKTSKLMIDLETANEQIVILELKNQEIFENLQKELAQRAKDYKERTLHLLGTPTRNFGKNSAMERSAYNFSPALDSLLSQDETEIRSPPKAKKMKDCAGSSMPMIDLIGRTHLRSSSLSKAQQDRINSAALKLMRKNESPLKNIRVTSPNRRSPTRPVPYRAFA